jgi:hypothetical protein
MTDIIYSLQLYAEPLLKERETIHQQFDQREEFLLGGPSFCSRLRNIFRALGSVIKQTGEIYSYHILNDAPPDNIEDMLDFLKYTAEQIPPYSPGESSLAWPYFVAAAETSVPAKRTFFSKRLMGICERGSFVDTTSALVLLHHIWNSQGAANSWTKALQQTHSAFVLK